MVDITVLTGDLTVYYLIGSIAVLLFTGTGCYAVMRMVKGFMVMIEPYIDRAKNEVYLDGIYTSYKAGIVIKTAEEEGVTLIPRPIEIKAEKNIADTLKEQVKKEISQ